VICDVSHADVTALLEGAGDCPVEPVPFGEGLWDFVAVGEFVGVGLGVCTAAEAAGEVADVDAAVALPDHGRATSNQTIAMTIRTMSSTISRRRRYTAFDGRGRGSGVVTVTG
jgi:hypothetical protein